MFIKCPKCEFEQPKDRYCARCGIDINTFEAPELNITQKIINMPMFYGSLLVFLLVSTYVYFYEQINHRIAQNLTRQSAARIVNFNSDNADSDNISDPGAAQHNLEVKAAGDLSAIKVNTTNEKSSEAKSETSAKIQSTEPIQAIDSEAPTEPLKFNTPKQIHVRFKRISASDLNILRSQSNVKSHSEIDIVVPKLKSESIALPFNDDDENRFPGSQSALFEIGQPLDMQFIGMIPGNEYQPEEEFGLSVSLTINTFDASTGVAMVQLRIDSSFRDTEGQFYTRSLDNEIKLPTNRTSYVARFMPRVKPPDEDIAQLQRTPAAIYSSDDFTEGYSDLLLEIEFK